MTEPTIDSTLAYMAECRDVKLTNNFFETSKYFTLAIRALEEMKANQENPDKGWTYDPEGKKFYKVQGMTVRFRSIEPEDSGICTKLPFPKPRSWTEVTIEEILNTRDDVLFSRSDLLKYSRNIVETKNMPPPPEEMKARQHKQDYRDWTVREIVDKAVNSGHGHVVASFQGEARYLVGVTEEDPREEKATEMTKAWEQLKTWIQENVSHHSFTTIDDAKTLGGYNMGLRDTLDKMTEIERRDLAGRVAALIENLSHTEYCKTLVLGQDIVHATNKMIVHALRTGDTAELERWQKK